MALATPAFTDSGLVTLKSSVMHSPPQAQISPATFSLFSISGEATIIAKLALHSVWAIARPMPRLAPVTSATR